MNPTYTRNVCIVPPMPRQRGTTGVRRLNVTLPADIVDLLDRVAAKGDRSRVIAEAVRSYVADQSSLRIGNS